MQNLGTLGLGPGMHWGFCQCTTRPDAEGNYYRVYFGCHFQVLEASGLIMLGDFNIHCRAGLSGVVQEYTAPNRAVGQYDAASMINLIFCFNQEAVLTVEKSEVFPGVMERLLSG